MTGEGKFFDKLMKEDLVVGGTVMTANKKKILYEDFKQAPVMSAVVGSAAATTGASYMNLGKNTFLINPITTQTLIAPVIAATGLDVSGDATDDEGRDIDFSGSGSVIVPTKSFKVGNGAFYGKLRFSISVVATTDLCAFGFRKCAAFNGDMEAYTDYATLNVVSGDIKMTTEINGAGVSTTDTTDDWADTEVHTLAVFVSNAGVVTYEIDGVAPTVTAALTLDSGDSFLPFHSHLQAASTALTIIFEELEVGLQ